ncbi:hypothetical protein BV401_00065 [Streptomyces malaysiensis subsp. malaysiensis]|uniref:Malonyl-CoA:ACP transacylase (MAT) domain-containing protein n=1 Tax=Streptomyces autolyticus TaxID=75293 RepID=A0ABM6H5N0_9ACTN|nr:hypothetical protein BV401_00065 [Streptomyces autolyticus]
MSGIPLDGLNLQVVTGCGSWRGGRRVAGVGSFGLGGADCHVVVAARLPDGFAAPASPGRAAVSGRAAVCGAVPVVVSGRTSAALRAQAARLSDWVDGHPGSGLVDLGGCLLSSCTFFDRRVVSLGVDGLRVLAAGGVGGNVVIGRAAVVVGRRVFVFPGRGSQWVGMAREFMGGSLVFAARMDECGQVLESFTGWCLVDVLGEVDVLERAEVVQSVVWVVVVLLAAVWRSLGVVPGAVLGYFRGEVAAVVVAGALLLEEGACVVALCAWTVGVLAGCGGMTSLVLSARGVRALIGPGFSVAAVIGSSSVVVVAAEALAVLEVLAGERDVRVRRLPGFCAPV